MSTKNWMLVFADGDPSAALRARPALDRDAAFRLATSLFPKDRFEEIGTGDLSHASPEEGELHVGYFPGAAVVAAKEFATDYPSHLSSHFLTSTPFDEVYLHAMYSETNWFAFSHWTRGRLVRALSASVDIGLLEDMGRHVPFEEPYWAGRYPANAIPDDPEPNPLPFHPLDMGEAALRALFGYQLEGFFDPALFEPEDIALLRLRHERPRWWRFWR